MSFTLHFVFILLAMAIGWFKVIHDAYIKLTAYYLIHNLYHAALTFKLV